MTQHNFTSQWACKAQKLQLIQQYNEERERLHQHFQIQALKVNRNVGGNLKLEPKTRLVKLKE